MIIDAGYIDDIGKIVVVGLGSIGSYVLYSLCDRFKYKRIEAIDYDKVETGNIKSSIYENVHIGEMKVSAMKDIVKYQDNVELIFGKFPYNIVDIAPNDMIIDCSDMYLDDYITHKNMCKISSSGNIFHVYKGKTFKNILTNSIYSSKDDIKEFANEFVNLIQTGEIVKIFNGIPYHYKTLTLIERIINETNKKSKENIEMNIEENYTWKTLNMFIDDIEEDYDRFIIIKENCKLHTYYKSFMIGIETSDMDKKLSSLDGKKIRIITELTNKKSKEIIMSMPYELSFIKRELAKLVEKNYNKYGIEYYLYVLQENLIIPEIIISSAASCA